MKPYRGSISKLADGRNPYGNRVKCDMILFEMKSRNQTLEIKQGSMEYEQIMV